MKEIFVRTVIIKGSYMATGRCGYVPIMALEVDRQTMFLFPATVKDL